MSAYAKPSPDLLKSRGRIVTLGMFIIDHFAVKDDSGNAVPAGEEAIGGGGIFCEPIHAISPNRRQLEHLQP